MPSSDKTRLNAFVVLVQKKINKRKTLKAVQLFMLLNITQHFLKTEKYVRQRRKMDKLHLMEG